MGTERRTGRKLIYRGQGIASRHAYLAIGKSIRMDCEKLLYVFTSTFDVMAARAISYAR